MIDLVSVNACDSGTREGISRLQRKLHQTFEVFEFKLLAVIVDEEEPVATPRNVTRDWSITRHINRYLRSSSITRNIRDFDLSVCIEFCDDNTDRRLDAMNT